MDEIKWLKNILWVMTGFVISLIFMFIIFNFLGCGVSLPVRDKMESAQCFNMRQCLYLIQDSKEKSGCKTMMDECSKVTSFEYCKDEKNRPADVAFQSCWDKLR